MLYKRSKKKTEPVALDTSPVQSHEDDESDAETEMFSNTKI